MTEPIQVEAHIRKAATGEVRIWRGTIEAEAIDAASGRDEMIAAQIYLWTDGNYGCDCNRGLFFDELGGAPREQQPARQCGSERFELARLLIDGEDMTAADWQDEWPW